MFKNLLIVSFALLMVTGSANAFHRKPAKIETDLLSAFPGVVEPQNRWSTRADQSSLDFSIADPVYTAFKLNNINVGDIIYLAFEMSGENATAFANDEITSVNITTGSYTMGQTQKNAVKEVTIFITPDLQQEPVYTQSGTLGTGAYTEYKVPLTTPYKIEAGKSFYVGYYFKVPNRLQYYIPTDGIITDNVEAGWVGVVSNNTVQWNNYGSQIGSICIGCTIEGDNFPLSNVDFYDYSGSSYVNPGENLEYLFLLKNKGVKASNVEIEYTIGDAAPVTLTADLLSLQTQQPATLAYNEYGMIEVPMSCNKIGLNLPLSVKITKVDGEPNIAPDNVFNTTIDCFERAKGFDRVHLIEEGTGAWCGWCPRGIVMMEYVAEKYPDLFAGIALHVDDEMEAASAMPVASALFRSFPSAFIDRTYDLRQMSSEEIDDYADEFKGVPAAMGFSELTATMIDDVKLRAEAKVGSSLDITNGNRYRLAYYLTQNNVGPYNQSNNYSGGGSGAMGGWEYEGTSVSTIYNDVCRYLLGGLTGISNSLPAEIKSGEDASYTAEMTTSAVNAAEFYLTAFIVDSQTGEIVNAKQIKVEKEYSAVKEISDDATVVSRKYYSISGAEVENPSNGIFIVRSVYSDGKVINAKVALK